MTPDSIIRLLGRLRDVKFSGSVKINFSDGAPRAVRIRQLAPLDLGGVVLLQAAPTCAACGWVVVRSGDGDGPGSACPNCGAKSGRG